MQPSGRGYDHGVSTFSPDGRLYQVEYARESVKRGTTTVGLKYKDGVILIVDKRISSKLIIIANNCKPIEPTLGGGDPGALLALDPLFGELAVALSAPLP